MISRFRELSQIIYGKIRPLVQIGGVEANGCKNVWKRVRQLDRSQARFQIQRGYQHSRHARGNGSLNDRIAVLIEFIKIQVAMSVG
jgi:hypothetical protein